MTLLAAILLAVVLWLIVRELFAADQSIWASDETLRPWGLTVEVSRHALQRGHLRHQRSALEVAADVSAALIEGRTDRDLIHRFEDAYPSARSGCSYAWTPGYERVYVIRRSADRIVVVTALEPWPTLREDAEATKVAVALRGALV